MSKNKFFFKIFCFWVRLYNTICMQMIMLVEPFWGCNFMLFGKYLPYSADWDGNTPHTVVSSSQCLRSDILRQGLSDSYINIWILCPLLHNRQYLRKPKKCPFKQTLRLFVLDSVDAEPRHCDSQSRRDSLHFRQQILGNVSEINRYLNRNWRGFQSDIKHL